MDPQNTAAPQQPELTELLTVERSIKEHIAQIDKVQEELRPVKEMLQTFLDNDPTYREHTEIAKKAAQVKSATKKQLISTPNAKELNEKINMMKQDMKDAQEALSYYLREYQRLTGANEFEGEDGELRQIVYIAKLVRKTNLGK
jgi:uncharacterized protein (DUF3084 family)